jgi:NAD(P)-dependent dehydrogenase (short-subunit alcohol dehydrogenase family)
VDLLKDKVGLVTGGGSGIGRVTAMVAAKEGSCVTVSDKNRETGEETVDLIQKTGGKALFIRADVRSAEDIQHMITRTVETFGKLDWASNNAAGGSGAFGPIEQITDKTWDTTLDICLKGVFTCMKYEIPAMLENGKGSIINISSLVGIHGNAFQGAYAAAKGGIEALTKTAAAELAQRHIRVNSICPAAISTPGLERYFENFPDIREKVEKTHAMNRMGKPEEVADAVCYLASDRSSFITGHSLIVDGGSCVNTLLS